MADFLRTHNPKVELYLMATWSRADQIYPPSALGRPADRGDGSDVRAAYDKAAAGAAVEGGDPDGRGMDPRHAD